MWSLTSPRADRISGPEKFCSSARKDFFNSIGTFETCRLYRAMSALTRKADIPKRDLRHGYEDVDPFAAGHTARCGIGQSSLQSSLTVRGRPSKKYVMEDPCHRSSSPRAAAPLP